MPKVTIWIRKEDEKAWNAIIDKPDWLHKRLNPPSYEVIKKFSENLDTLLDVPGSGVTSKPPLFIDPIVEPYEESP